MKAQRQSVKSLKHFRWPWRFLCAIAGEGVRIILSITRGLPPGILRQDKLWSFAVNLANTANAASQKILVTLLVTKDVLRIFLRIGRFLYEVSFVLG